MSAVDPMQQAPMAQGMEPPDDGADDATFEQMVAGLTEHLAGKGGDAALKQITESKKPAETIGLITFHLVKAATDQAKQAGVAFDVDLILGVAADVIDTLIQMAEAARVKIGDPELFRAEAMFAAIGAYQASAPPGSEQQEAAKAMLAEMQANGMVEEGAQALQQLGARAGVDPFAQATQAAQAPQGAPPAAAGGLMGG